MNATTSLASNVRNTADEAIALGLCVLPPNPGGEKSPYCDRIDPETNRLGWKHRQEEPSTAVDLDTWYEATSRLRYGVGLVCGAVSNNLEVLDFDDCSAYGRFREGAVAIGLGDLVERIEGGYLEATPSDGRHWLYYCDGFKAKSHKLAQKAAGKGRKTLIETKGEGGFIIIAPSGGDTHPTKKEYQCLRGSLATIPTLNQEERDQLWALAASLDEVEATAPEPEAASGLRVPSSGFAGWELRPGDDYNHRASWGDVLGGAGWTRVHASGDVTYWRRPGKDHGCSASVRKDRLNVYSSSTEFDAVLENRRTYSRFEAYAQIHCKGDLKAAALKLHEAGFGRKAEGSSGSSGKARINEQANGHLESRDTGDATPDFVNFCELERQTPDGQKKTVRVPLRVAAIDSIRAEVTGDWPKRVDNLLFIEGRGKQPEYLETSSQLFAFMDRQTAVRWARGDSFVGQDRYFEHCRATVDRYRAVETVPHWPSMPDTYYMVPEIPGCVGRDRLRDLLDFFHPDTELDRQLIEAYALTLLWGGSPGCRPAFLFEGPHDDPEQGRGVGKTTLADAISEGIAGGYVDVQPTEDIGAIKTRLLSGEAMQKRVCRLDNLKTLRFSWADLEGLITAREISGKALYRGEGRRPNTMVWTITLNGASLSKDMARRVIPIRLRRPRYSPTWETEVREFIQRHRLEILASIRDRLTRSVGPIQARTRWARWEQDVLSRVEDLGGCQELILARQAAIDDDENEKDLVAGHFREQLVALHWNPDTDHVFIPTGIAAQWVEAATGEKRPTNRASSYLRALGVPELRKSGDGGRRGWRWRGAGCPASTPAEDHDSRVPRSFRPGMYATG
jgi:hypothetical protein